MEEKKEIKSTVPSLRLDALAGIGYSCSRSKAAQHIKDGKIIHEGKVVTNPAQNVEIGDTIEWENHGIVCLEEVEGETKKGRLRVVMSRMRKREDLR